MYEKSNKLKCELINYSGKRSMRVYNMVCEKITYHIFYFVENCRNLTYDFTCKTWKSMVKYINNYSNNNQRNFFQKIQNLLQLTANLLVKNCN